VENFTDYNLKNEIEDLRDALSRFRQEKGFGRGIAAVQLGIPKRMIALNFGNETFVIINPEITFRSQETFCLWDDCMSFPDLLVKVKRHSSIEVRYQDEEGVVRELKTLGQAESELLQHEIDHLNGILAIDKVVRTCDIIYKVEYLNRRHLYDTDD